MKQFLRNLFETDEIDTKHVGVLDGVRAFAVIFVCGFHFWQQSWLWNLWPSDKLQWLGIEDCGLNWLYSTGYEWVDMMILLTGLCLFLPYANRMVDSLTGKRQKLPKVGEFYAKRIARIVPSYYFFLIISLIFFVRASDYASKAVFAKDVATHFSFTHMLWYENYLGSKFNGVVWTLSLEAAFYVVFPLLARCFYKKPFITYLGMCGGSLLYYVLVMRKHFHDTAFYINRFPSFLCVFANGMMTALIICYLAKNMKQSKITGAAFTVLAAGALYLIRLTLKYQLAPASEGQKWQIQNRYAVTILFSVFIVGAVFSYNIFRRIFSNAVTRFFADISFNLYLWHQFISLKMKEWKIPYWEAADGMPQKLNDKVWQWKYTIVIWTVSILVAFAVTYLIEKPMHKLIMKGYGKLENKIAGKAENKKRISKSAGSDGSAVEEMDL